MVLLVASLIFYAWGEPVYVLIMLFSTVFDYTNGRLIEYFQKKNCPGKAKVTLVIDLIGNLGILGFFKYADFFIGNLNTITGAGLSLLHIALPIGISFYTFQTMSYTIDVYRKVVPAQRNILDFATYVTLFPQLIAGPIVQYKTVAKDLANRKVSLEDFSEGAFRFSVGLAKKVLLANQIGSLWDTISQLHQMSAATASHIRSRFTLISRDTRTWRSDSEECLVSISWRILISLICQRQSPSSGDAGIFRSARGSASMCTFHSAATARV